MESGNCHMSLYKALEIPVTASYYQIRKSFHRLARKMCPDRHLNHPNWPAINEKFAYLIFAYEILKDPDTRVIYGGKGFPGLRSVGVSIPAGFQDTSSVKPSSSCSTKENESRAEKKEKDVRLRSERFQKITREKMRLQTEVFQFAVYKQVIKIAWKKELMR